MVGLDRDFIQKLKVVGSESAISFSGIGGAIGSSVPGKPQTSSGNYLAIAGGAMSGAIAFNLKVLTIDTSGSIDVTPLTGAYTGYMILGTHGAAPTDDLQQIIGAHDDGQLLWIQAISGQTITIKNDASGIGSGGFNIRTPALTDFVLKGSNAVLLYFDPAENQWAFMDSSYFDNISNGGISGDLDMHNFKILNLGALQFTNGGISDATKRQIFCTSNYMAFEFPNINDEYRFNWSGVTNLQIFRDRILPTYNLSGSFSSMTLGDSTHIWNAISVKTAELYGIAAFIGPLSTTGWITACYPFNDMGADLGVQGGGGYARWNNLFMGGILTLFESFFTNKYLTIYKDTVTHNAIYSVFDSVSHSFQIAGSEIFKITTSGASLVGTLICGGLQTTIDNFFSIGSSATRFIINGNSYLAHVNGNPTPSVTDIPNKYFIVHKDNTQPDGSGVKLFYNDNTTLVSVALT